MSNAQVPFRYDIVGSFLRKWEVIEAREQYAEGKITVEDLKKVEDNSIQALVN